MTSLARPPRPQPCALRVQAVLVGRSVTERAGGASSARGDSCPPALGHQTALPFLSRSSRRRACHVFTMGRVKTKTVKKARTCFAARRRACGEPGRRGVETQLQPPPEAASDRLRPPQPASDRLRPPQTALGSLASPKHHPHALGLLLAGPPPLALRPPPRCADAHAAATAARGVLELPPHLPLSATRSADARQAFWV